MENLDLFAPASAPVPKPARITARGRAGRDATIDVYATRRADITAALQAEAWRVWNTTHEPVSTNDIRHILTREGYRGDPRVLAAAFPRKTWEPCGITTTTSERANARPIRLFRPRRGG